MLQEFDSPLRTYQQLVLQPVGGPERDAADGVQVLGELPDDIAWVMPPLAATTGPLPNRRRRLLRGTGSKGLLARLRGQDVLALLDAGPDAVLAVDSANRVVLYNQAAERVFGHRGTEVLGRSADLLVAPAARGVLALLRQQVLDGARPGPGGEALIPRDGSPR